MNASAALARTPLFLLCLLFSTSTMGQSLPTPPEGYEWIKNDAFSDEFEGSALDRDKWHDHNPKWAGRPPGKFMPSSVSVQDGFLQIKSTVLDPADGEFTIACGAVQSKAQNALFGYYECRMKASSISTSSTFWLTSDPKPIPWGEIRLELDIQECIGNAQRWPKFKNQMKGNTHIKLTPNEKGTAWLAAQAELESQSAKNHESPSTNSNQEETSAEEKIKEQAKQAAERLVLKKGGGVNLKSNVDAEFHTYGCWWVDANTIKFYADGEYAFTIEPLTAFDKTPFNHPMFMNLVCETYSWEVLPTVEDLQDDLRNTTYYDYVRSYKLAKVDASDSDVPSEGSADRN